MGIPVNPINPHELPLKSHEIKFNGMNFPVFFFSSDPMKNQITLNQIPWKSHEFGVNFPLKHGDKNPKNPAGLAGVATSRGGWLFGRSDLLAGRQARRVALGLGPYNRL